MTEVNTSDGVILEALNNKVDIDLNNVNDILNDVLYYKSGDTFQLIRSYIAGGHVTGSGKDIYFTVIVEKNLSKISNITVNTLKTNIRNTAGKYIPQASAASVTGGYDILTDNTLTVTVVKSTSNSIFIRINSTTAYDNTTNNTPVSVQLEALNLTFS